MRPPMSGTHRWSRPKAGASHWGGVPPQTARPRSAKKAAVAVIHHVVGRPVSSRRYTIFPISPNDWRLGEGGSRMSLCWIAYLKPLPYSLTWFLTGRDLISGSGFWYLSVCRRSVSPCSGRVLTLTDCWPRSSTGSRQAESRSGHRTGGITWSSRSIERRKTSNVLDDNQPPKTSKMML